MRILITILISILFSTLQTLTAQQYEKELDRIKRHNQYEITYLDKNILKLTHKLYGKEKYVNIT